MGSNIKRRDFMKWLGIGTAASAAVAAGTTQVEPSVKPGKLI